MATAFHIPPGSTKVVPGYGPPPAVLDEGNIIKLANRIAYLRANGFGGSFVLRAVQRGVVPGLGEPPTDLYVAFTWAGKSDQESVHSFDLFLLTPEVTLVELESDFGFADPKIYIPYTDPVVVVPPTPPVPSQPPANPIGAESFTGSGVFFPAPGDTAPDGNVFTAQDGVRYQKHIRMTPFGPQAFWKKL